MADNHSFDETEYFQYTEERISSEGFDVKSDYGRYILGGIVRIGREESNIFQHGEEAAQFAVAQEDANLEFLKIVNLTKEPTAGAMYYITLEARDLGTNEVKLYQTKVWRKISSGFKVELFRPAKKTRSY